MFSRFKGWPFVQFLSWLLAVSLLALSPATAYAQSASADPAYLSDITAQALERVNLIIGSFSVIFTLLFIVVGVVIYGSIRELKSETRELIDVAVASRLQDQGFIGSKIDASVQKAVREEVDRRVMQLNSLYDQLNTKFEISTLYDQAASVKAKSSFSNAERDELVRQLQHLDGREGLEGNAQFITALENTIDSFFAAGLRHQIAEIEMMYEDILASQQRYVLTLVQHYGLIVIGAVEPNESEVQRLRFYIDACEKQKRHDVALIYRIALHAKTNAEWRGVVESYLNDAASLAEPQRSTFRDAFIHNIDPGNVAREPEARHDRFSAVFALVVSEFDGFFRQGSTEDVSQEVKGDPVGK